MNWTKLIISLVLVNVAIHVVTGGKLISKDTPTNKRIMWAGVTWAGVILFYKIGYDKLFKK